ncbi:DUF885 family protein [Streptomyces capitiformicae]|uniref:DUF885 domain-containing protein n=1 Tax=Streptomyces capitiformicae TaxID=2014920 RepID=A0A918Z239_9ACTN|nr:DUF885 family protein [Streptomyces capitiformicae]GHE34678.1 hypothetical protein GCM10017771_52400 [Streptomyces capitiformicae]
MTVTDHGAGRATARLAREFWAWRAAQRPHSRDDIPRLDRPTGWTPDWSTEGVARHRETLSKFRQAVAALAPRTAPVPVHVNHRLVSSAVARAGWELDTLRLWQRHPGFYVDQALGAVYDLLLPPPPFGPARAEAVLRHLRDVSRVLDWAEGNTRNRAEADFAALTVRELEDIETRLARAVRELTPHVPEVARELSAAADSAARALSAFRERWRARMPDLPPYRPVGEGAFQRYLAEVALLPWTVAELRTMGEREDDRAAMADLVGTRHGSPASEPALPADAATQCAWHAAAEEEVRAFYRDRALLDLPADLPRYRTAPLPGYLAELSWLGITDDLTGPARLTEDAVSYVPPPCSDLPYFDRANAHDPRLGIIHEGVHHQQLAMSWRHPDPVRRHFHDSAVNEGIAFYHEELVLLAGLFDDSPASRRTVHNFMRLRSARVGVDIALAVGGLTIPEAAELLVREVPLDNVTAHHEAAFFALTPGQGLSYQAGKTQVLALLADARRVFGERFELRRFHNHLWRNGNVPLSLLRWEYLGDREELDRADALVTASA